MKTEGIEIFKPGIAELRKLAESYRGLKINGINDTEGYEAAKAAKKTLADWRIKITKAGKQFREEAIAYQKEVIRQEKEHLSEILPVEDGLKMQIEEIDFERKREERRVLLPARKAMLAEIELQMEDDDILDLDENGFAAVYGNAKMAYLETKERAAREELEKKKREEEIAKAKEEAAAKAVEEERARAEREKAAEEKRKADEEARQKAAEEARKLAEAEEIIRTEKNRRYKAWLKENGVTDENKADFHIEREEIALSDGSKKETTFTLFKKIGSITIK